MKVHDAMTRDVVSVPPDELLKDVARTLVDHNISGVPVCDADGHVLGVISEGDILFKEQGRIERRGGPLAWLVDGNLSAAAAKSQARTVREAMSAPPITISPERPVAAAARLMMEKHVNRLPVVTTEGTLVGIVTRADLVRAFTRPDDVIAEDIKDLLRRVLWADPETFEIRVKNGEVELEGEVETSAELDVLERLVEKTPGVVSLYSNVTHRVDTAAHAGRLAGSR